MGFWGGFCTHNPLFSAHNPVRLSPSSVSLHFWFLFFARSSVCNSASDTIPRPSSLCPAGVALHWPQTAPLSPIGRTVPSRGRLSGRKPAGSGSGALTCMRGLRIKQSPYFQLMYTNTLQNALLDRGHYLNPLKFAFFVVYEEEVICSLWGYCGK